MRDLGHAADALAAGIGATEEDPEVSAPALQPVVSATRLTPAGRNMSLCVLVVYTQATATDLLRALGIDHDPAQVKVGRAVETALV